MADVRLNAILTADDRMSAVLKNVRAEIERTRKAAAGVAAAAAPPAATKQITERAQAQDRLIGALERTAKASGGVIRRYGEMARSLSSIVTLWNQVPQVAGRAQQAMKLFHQTSARAQQTGWGDAIRHAAKTRAWERPEILKEFDTVLGDRPHGGVRSIFYSPRVPRGRPLAHTRRPIEQPELGKAADMWREMLGVDVDQATTTYEKKARSFDRVRDSARKAGESVRAFGRRAADSAKKATAGFGGFRKAARGAADATAAAGEASRKAGHRTVRMGTVFREAARFVRSFGERGRKAADTIQGLGDRVAGVGRTMRKVGDWAAGLKKMRGALWDAFRGMGGPKAGFASAGLKHDTYIKLPRILRRFYSRARVEAMRAQRGLASFGKSMGGVARKVGSAINPLRLVGRGMTALKGAVMAGAAKVALLATGIGALVVGIGALVIGLARMVTGGIRFVGQMQMMEIQFENLVGSSEGAREHIEGLASFAAKTPFQLEGIAQASRHLLTFGGQALATKQNLRLFGDAAAGTSRPIEEVSMWVGRMYSSLEAGRPIGEATARLQEMGVLGGPARVVLEEMAESGASASEVMARFKEEIGRFDGSMEKMSSTIPGLHSTFGDLTAQLAGGIVEALQLDHIWSGLMKTINALLTGLLWLVNGFNSLTETLGSAVGPALRGIGAAAAWLWDKLVAGFKWAWGWVKGFEGVFATLGTWFDRYILKFIQRIDESKQIPWKIKKMVQVLALLVWGLDKLVVVLRNIPVLWDATKDAMAGAWDWTKKAASATWDFGKALVKGAWEALAGTPAHAAEATGAIEDLDQAMYGAAGTAEEFRRGFVRTADGVSATARAAAFDLDAFNESIKGLKERAAELAKKNQEVIDARLDRIEEEQAEAARLYREAYAEQLKMTREHAREDLKVRRAAAEKRLNSLQETLDRSYAMAAAASRKLIIEPAESQARAQAIINDALAGAEYGPTTEEIERQAAAHDENKKAGMSWAGAMQELAWQVGGAFAGVVDAVSNVGYALAAGDWIGAAVAGVLAVWNTVKGIGGPSEAEKAGREAATDWLSGLRSGLSRDQLQEALGSGWADTDLAASWIGMRDAALEAGLSIEQAERYWDRLQEAIKQGPDAVAAVRLEFEGLVEDSAAAAEAQQKFWDGIYSSAVGAFQRAKDAGEAAYKETQDAHQAYLDAVKAGDDKRAAEMVKQHGDWVTTKEAAVARGLVVEAEARAATLKAEGEKLARMAAFEAALREIRNGNAEGAAAAARQAALDTTLAWETAIGVVTAADDAAETAMKNNAGEVAKAKEAAADRAVNAATRTANHEIEEAGRARTGINNELDQIQDREVRIRYGRTGIPPGGGGEGEGEGFSAHGGGVFHGPATGYPVTLHGTETVVPGAHPGLVSGGGSAPQIVVNVSGADVLDSRRLGDVVADAVVGSFRRRGARF